MSFWRKDVIQPALAAEEEATIREQEELLRKDPADPKPYFALGTMAQIRGHAEGAVQYFLKAIEIDPSFSPPRVSLGRIYALWGQNEAAWKCAREAERLGDRSLVEQLERYPTVTKLVDPA